MFLWGGGDVLPSHHHHQMKVFSLGSQDNNHLHLHHHLATEERQHRADGRVRSSLADLYLSLAPPPSLPVQTGNQCLCRVAGSQPGSDPILMSLQTTQKNVHEVQMAFKAE